jgi:hypothetical protein
VIEGGSNRRTKGCGWVRAGASRAARRHDSAVEAGKLARLIAGPERIEEETHKARQKALVW